jgi:glycosyltransferase involved in cell wall biosynthesis
MACGLPLIATGSTGSIARNNKEGFIIPSGNVEILKNKIKYFYDNPLKIEKFGRAARKRVEGYSWDDYGKRLGKEYGRILNG